MRRFGYPDEDASMHMLIEGITAPPTRANILKVPSSSMCA
jgi:hypothetical protein